MEITYSATSISELLIKNKLRNFAVLLAFFLLFAWLIDMKTRRSRSSLHKILKRKVKLIKF